MPHALLGLLVLVQPGAFASRASYLLALSGMAYMTVLNGQRAATLLLPGAPPPAPAINGSKKAQ